MQFSGRGIAINLQPSVRCASGGGIPIDGVASRLTCLKLWYPGGCQRGNPGELLGENIWIPSSEKQPAYRSARESSKSKCVLASWSSSSSSSSSSSWDLTDNTFPRNGSRQAQTIKRRYKSSLTDKQTERCSTTTDRVRGCRARWESSTDEN